MDLAGEGCKGCEVTPMFSFHSVNLQYFLHSVNSAIVLCLSADSTTILYQAAALRFDVHCASGKFKISELIFVIGLALKFNKSFKVISI